MQKLVLNAKDRTYNIFCGQNLLNKAPSLFNIKGGKICIITDTNVAPLYIEKLKDSFTECDNADLYEYIFTAGEQSKTLKTCISIYNFLAEKGFTKSDVLIALGGGVCGDLTGFIASTYLRGIKFYSVATTLLAQVDSSIGGKCGVDIPYGKNLVGSFYQPFGVVSDTLLLNTLKVNDFNDGMAEVIKYGFIYDKNVYDKCLINLKDNLNDIIFRCIDIKREVVEKDEYDNGLRMILNFGHTVGHAVEKLGNYSSYTHGQAVAIGMVYAAKLSEVAGTAKKGLYDQVKNAVKLLGLPYSTDYSVSEILPVLLNDKKNREGKLNFILLSDIGKSLVYKVDSKEVESFLKQAFI